MLTGGMLVKFLKQHLAPLQSHTRPMWEYQGVADDLRPRSEGLTGEELDKSMNILLEEGPGNLPEAYAPLYCHVDKEAPVTAMPVFNSWGSCRSSSPTPRCRCRPATTLAKRARGLGGDRG